MKTKTSDDITNNNIIPIFGEKALLYFTCVSDTGERAEGAAEVDYLSSNMLEIRGEVTYHIFDEYGAEYYLEGIQLGRMS